MKKPNPDETRLLLEAKETAEGLHAAGVFSDDDLQAVAKLCEQRSSQSELTPLTAKQHAAIAKARPSTRAE